MSRERDAIERGWGRLAATGKMAGSAARLAARRVMKSDGPADAEIGAQLARELDGMKGLAMKVGQILSYFDGVLPEATHAALRSLQRGATPLAFSSLEPVIEGAFGEPVDVLFEAFDRTPVAAASIGQVYRARYNGQPVAVKVQYPGIRDTIEGDFQRLGSLARIASLATAVDGAAIVAELRARIVEECDYRLEAQHQNAFAAAFATTPGVAIPRPIAERTRPTVLTSEWAEGDDFYAFAEGASAARRNEVALTLVRFAMRSLFGLEMLNADPHPGNYLFPPDGAVVFLDFGCVRHFDEFFIEPERQIALALLDGDERRFREAVLATGMVPRPKSFDFDAHWQMLAHQYAPYRAPRFRFTREYLAAGTRHTGPHNPNLRKLAIPPAWIWMQRAIWGLHAVLVRLEAEAAFGDVLREALEPSARHVDPSELSSPGG